MKKKLLFVILLAIFSLTSYSQIIFENGYFIDDSNKKVECLIKNVDWENNPSKFDYKLTENGEILKADIKSVNEFRINGSFKYVRALVKIDRSGENINNLSTIRNPVFEEKTLFLRQLIEGNSELFEYKEINLTRFFYKTNDLPIEQLVYKQYSLNGGIATNDYFKQQLFNSFKEQDITLEDLKNIKYEQSDLKSFFIKINKNSNSNYVISESKEENIKFNLSLRPGLNFSSLSTKNGSNTNDYGSKSSPRFGIEAEFTLPFNKNKWAIIIEPTYQYFKSTETKETSSFSGGVTTTVDYQSIELPAGIRHYLFLNDNSKLFVNLSYIYDFSGKSNIESIRNSNGSVINKLDIASRPNWALGMGYKFKNKYSAEIRYQTSRMILNDYKAWDSNYKTIAILVGYTLF